MNYLLHKRVATKCLCCRGNHVFLISIVVVFSVFFFSSLFSLDYPKTFVFLHFHTTPEADGCGFCCFECLHFYRPVMTFCSKFKTSFEHTEKILSMLYRRFFFSYVYLRCIQQRMNIILYKQCLNRTHCRRQTHLRSRDILLCA